MYFAFIHTSPRTCVHAAPNTKSNYIGQEPYLEFLILKKLIATFVGA